MRRTAVIDSPVGRLRVTATERGLAEVRLGARGRTRAPEQAAGGDRALRHLRRACRQLAEYFAGRRRRFDLALDLSAGTAFQQAVWRACAAVPYGRTTSYGELARQVGRPRGARAVGGAVGANPVPIVVPCHRVIRSDGSLGGFGPGPSLKRRLLEWEGVRDVP